MYPTDKCKITARKLLEMKAKGEKIAMLVAYDYPMALLAEKAGVDIVLVGDSVGMVVLGYKSTVPVTVDEIIHHSKAVVRGVSRTMVVGDMPYLSYEMGPEEAMRNVGRLVKESGVDAVKMEGGKAIADTVETVVKKLGVPVMAHIGLTPQRAAVGSGGYRLQGKDAKSAREIVEDAIALEKGGVFAAVLEFTTAEVAKMVAEKLTVPIIGIGAGPYCDGQVLLGPDLLGISETVPPFAKRYLDLNKSILHAFQEYIEDTRSGRFPTEEHYSHMDKEEYQKLLSSPRP